MVEVGQIRKQQKQKVALSTKVGAVCENWVSAVEFCGHYYVGIAKIKTRGKNAGKGEYSGYNVKNYTLWVEKLTQKDQYNTSRPKCQLQKTASPAVIGRFGNQVKKNVRIFSELFVLF